MEALSDPPGRSVSEADLEDYQIHDANGVSNVEEAGGKKSEPLDVNSGGENPPKAVTNEVENVLDCIAPN